LRHVNASPRARRRHLFEQACDFFTKPADPLGIDAAATDASATTGGAPSTGSGGRVVVGIDRRRRRFTGSVAELVGARDRQCRDPFCTAPIRHLDHIVRYTDGGSTTAVNGRGVCERGNYVREMPGWTVKLLDPASHTIVTTTPTGHRYLSRPDEPP